MKSVPTMPSADDVFSDAKDVSSPAASRSPRMRISGNLPTTSQSGVSLASRGSRGGGCPRLKQFVASTYFEGTFAMLIMLNALAIGVEVDFEVTRGADRVPPAFKWLSGIFAVAFIFELLLRVSAQGIRSGVRGPPETARGQPRRATQEVGRVSRQRYCREFCGASSGELTCCHILASNRTSTFWEHEQNRHYQSPWSYLEVGRRAQGARPQCLHRR